MSVLHGKWTEADIRAVIRTLDEKTGMKGAELPIHLVQTIRDGRVLGMYHPSSGGNKYWCSFSFARDYFDSDSFQDLAVIDVIRHEYCHYLVDELGLEAVFEDKSDHGTAWKTVCGLLNTDREGSYVAWHFSSTTESRLREMSGSMDIPAVDIPVQINRWGKELPSLHRRRYLEDKLAKKYTRARIFKVNDRVIHDKYGQGTVLDTMPMENKQMLYVAFEDGRIRFVQNRYVYKLVNGQVHKPARKNH